MGVRRQLTGRFLPPEDRAGFAARLRETRYANDITQYELAAVTGTSQTAISALERGSLSAVPAGVDYWLAARGLPAAENPVFFVTWVHF
jgi:transcriptional regulator with XRE-family HTH domain